MGAMTNLTAAGALETARHTRKSNKLSQAHAGATEHLLAAVANELAESNRLAREANVHAIALVNEQQLTNSLLTALLNKGN